MELCIANNTVVSGLSQVALTVHDLEAAKQFYQQALGLPLLFEAGSMAFFQCGAVRLMIGLAEGTPVTASTLLYLKVSDIHAMMGHVEQYGVRVVQSPHIVAKLGAADLWLAFVEDPSGNKLGFMCEMQA